MRILQVTDGYPPEQGFAPRWCQHLSRALAARGHAVRVLSLGRSRAALAWGAADADEGVSVRRCPPSPPLYALHRLRTGERGQPPPWSAELRALLWNARRLEDVFHLHGSPPHALSAWASSRLGRRRFVVTPHLDVGRPLRGAARWLVRVADAVIASEAECSWLRESGVRRTGFVPVETPAPLAPAAGEACRERLGLEAPDHLLVFAGAIDWQTGALTFVDAVRLLRLEGWRAVAVLLGEYRPEDDFIRRLWQAGLVPVLELPVLAAAARDRLLAEADAIVLPPEWRAVDLLEARLAGTRVLAPGRADGSFVPPGVVLFERGSPPSLARAVVELLRHPARTTAAQPAAAATWSGVAERVEATYERLVAPGGTVDLEARKHPSGRLGREPSGV